MWTICILLLCMMEYAQCMKGYFKILEEEPVEKELFEVSNFLRPRLKFDYKMTIVGDKTFTECISIQEKTGTTRITRRIDREAICLEVQDQLNGKCVKSIRLMLSSINRKESVDLEFEIVDINDNKPTWPISIVNISYPESPEKQAIKLAIAYDKDIGDNARIKYYLQSINQDNLNFNLENIDNRLILVPKFDIDFETKKFFNITIVAEDRGMPTLSSILIVHMFVIDINDNRPQFSQNVFQPNHAVYETTQVDKEILTVSATDKDSDQNGRITYYIDPSMPQFVKDHFSLDPDTGKLRLKKPLDYDRGHKSYRFLIIAKDNAPAPYEMSSSATVEIQVADVNDEIPQIKPYFITSYSSISDNGTFHINIPENMNPQQFDLAHIQIEDSDEEDKAFVDCFVDNKDSFRLTPDTLKVKSFTLSATKSFDREQQMMEHVRISCRDNGRNENSKFVIINITDKNDNPPIFLQHFSFKINENTSYRHQDIGRVTATDKDQGRNAELRYKILAIHPSSYVKFQLDAISGKIFIDIPLDREEQDHYNLTITASDQGDPSLTGTGFVSITVEDMNDWPPVFDSVEYKFKISEENPVNSKVGVVHATDRDSENNAKITYHFITDSYSYGYRRTNSMEKFHIKRDTGEITITSRLDRESKSSYLLNVEALNEGSSKRFSATTTVHVIVLDYNDNAPRFFAPQNGSLITIDTDKSIGTEIVMFRASDTDELKNSNIMYSIVSASDPYLFNLEYASGVLFLAKKIENYRKFRLTVRACDTGEPRKCSEDLSIFIATTKPTIMDSDNTNEYPLSKTGNLDSNGAIIACLIVIFVILVMAMVVMFFLIRNKNLIWRRRMDSNYDKASVSEMQMRNPDSTFSKKDVGSIYEGDLLLLNDRTKANNMMHNSMYSPKIYAESHISGRAESPCYRTIEAMASSVYNPSSQVPGEIHMSHITCHPPSSMRYSQHQHFRGASEPAYRYSNLCGRNTMTPTISVPPSYYQSISSNPGTATIRLNKISNDINERFNTKVDHSNILVNYDARSMPRSVSLMKFYEKPNSDPETTNEKNGNYEGVNRAKYAYEALREGSFI